MCSFSWWSNIPLSRTIAIFLKEMNILFSFTFPEQDLPLVLAEHLFASGRVRIVEAGLLWVRGSHSSAFDIWNKICELTTRLKFWKPGLVKGGKKNYLKSSSLHYCTNGICIRGKHTLHGAGQMGHSGLMLNSMLIFHGGSLGHGTSISGQGNKKLGGNEGRLVILS